LEVIRANLEHFPGKSENIRANLKMKTLFFEITLILLEKKGKF